ncbi:MAG: hypothetical protein KDB68_13380 [Planctomycetes bacterium]|nr:hypothetical protein [Planctomycetota bacterium]
MSYNKLLPVRADPKRRPVNRTSLLVYAILTGTVSLCCFVAGALMKSTHVGVVLAGCANLVLCIAATSAYAQRDEAHKRKH